MNVILCRTPSGKGVKVLVNNEWLFTSVDSIEQVLKGDAEWCQLSTIQDRE